MRDIGASEGGRRQDETKGWKGDEGPREYSTLARARLCNGRGLIRAHNEHHRSTTNEVSGDLICVPEEENQEWDEGEGTTAETSDEGVSVSA